MGATRADGNGETRTDDDGAGGPHRIPWSSVVVVVVVGAVLYVLPSRIAGLDETWGRVRQGDPAWLCAALALEAASYGCYVLAFHRIFARRHDHLGARASYDITMAGVAATRLLAAGGAGGIALTAWALAHAGMARRELVSALTTFYVALYAVFMGALVVVGLGLRAGLLPGAAPFGVTVVPAVFGGTVIAVALLLALVPRDFADRVAPRVRGRRRAVRVRGRRRAVRVRGRRRAVRVLEVLARAAEALASGVRGALRLLRTRDLALAGVVGWWAFDIAVLGACFAAFGELPHLAVLIMGYFAGTIGNLLPLPGGLGGVEGGMIGAFVAFGVPAGLAVVAVLSYRAFAFWLPTIPGVVAYLSLRRRVTVWDREATAAS